MKTDPYHNLRFNEEIGVPSGRECVSIDSNLHIYLFYNGHIRVSQMWSTCEGGQNGQKLHENQKTNILAAKQ